MIEHQRIKRIGIIMETQDGRAFTIYSNSPGAQVTMERHVEYVPQGEWPTLSPPAFSESMEINISELTTWRVSAYRPEAQSDRLDAISKTLGDQ